MMFRVQGLVGKRLAVKPGTDINVGRILDGKPTIQTITIYSDVQESFQLKMLELSSPHMKVESRPLDADELLLLNSDPSAEKARAEMEEHSKTKARMDQ